MNFSSILQQAVDAGEIPDKLRTICFELYDSYATSLQQAGLPIEECNRLFGELLEMLKQQVRSPYHFAPYHQKVTQPYDYYRFGIDFIRPLVDQSHSHIHGKEIIQQISEQVEAGENVILFANHQTEVDPQLLSFVLETDHPDLASEVIFVAGDRVITDPLAVPFSMGRNLLCIYSKRHIDSPIEKKEEKLQHNQRTMHRMRTLLSEGKKFIYVAPSGGRDRPNAEGEVVVAPFDPQSIEMFRLMAKQANKPVHFYPLALLTYDILPPPHAIEQELGEIRRAKRDGILFAFGHEIDMETFPGCELVDRHEKRSARAIYIWKLVHANYVYLKSLL